MFATNYLFLRNLHECSCLYLARTQSFYIYTEDSLAHYRRFSVDNRDFSISKILAMPNMQQAQRPKRTALSHCPMLMRDCQENMKTKLVDLDLTALQSCVSCHSERSVEQGSRILGTL